MQRIMVPCARDLVEVDVARCYDTQRSCFDNFVAVMSGICRTRFVKLALTTGFKKSGSNGAETTHLYVHFGLFHLTLQGFYARPEKEADGSLNLLVWEVGIPGKTNVRERLFLRLDSLGGRRVQIENVLSRRVSI